MRRKLGGTLGVWLLGFQKRLRRGGFEQCCLQRKERSDASLLHVSSVCCTGSCHRNGREGARAPEPLLR